MCTISSFKGIENKQDVYRLKYNITKFSESLRKRAMEIINFKIKKNEISYNRAPAII